MTKILTRKQRVRDENQRKMYALLIKSKCADCPIDNFLVLEFDHVRGNKIESVSKMLTSGYRWETIQAEIDKCEIVCANCHHIRTMTRGNHWRVRMLNE